MEPSFVLRDCQTFSFEHARYSLRISACVRLITAICVRIPVLYIISTHLWPMMPKHSNAASISIETGSRPMRRAVNIFAVVMETWTVFTCHLSGLKFCLLRACVSKSSCGEGGGGLANINSSNILWCSQCGADGGEGILEQTLDSRGCGSGTRWMAARGSGRGYFRFLFNNCLFPSGFLLHAWTRCHSRPLQVQTAEKALTLKDLKCRRCGRCF